MQITTCYTVKIRNQLAASRDRDGNLAASGPRPVDGRLMKATEGICLAALEFCAETFLLE